ncbi:MULTISPECIES: hypothetical protein [Cyanophyceae]|uniref:ribbon-helix-helix domain-containing protein n=1 Tax=Cyanophyceae TaxID=3028117 RepID=UPI0018EFAFAA|nr:MULTISPECIES: hypothetical protein [unclassified Phormidium]
MTTKIVAKRFYISLPDGLAEYLEDWAAKEGNKPTTLAAFLVERAIRDKMDSEQGGKA